MLQESGHLTQKMWSNVDYLRKGFIELGFDIGNSETPIIPVMLGDAHVAVGMARRLMELGVYVTPFSYPVVPHGQARIRTQMSAAHTTDDIDSAVAAFVQAAGDLALVGGTP